MNKRISRPDSFQVAVAKPPRDIASIPRDIPEQNSLYIQASKISVLEREGLKLLSSCFVKSSQDSQFQVVVQFTGFRDSSAQRQISREMERFVQEAFSSSLILEEKKLLVINIQVLECKFIEILKHDLVNITSLSLANHGVEMSDLVIGSSIILKDGILSSNLTEKVDGTCSDNFVGIITVCYLPKLQTVSHIVQEGQITVILLKDVLSET